jgi:2-phospho-L-lactate transferase/gluconeogenesis factor (CofD/UPF0052 family)
MQTLEHPPQYDASEFEPTEFTMWGGGTAAANVATDVVDTFGDDSTTFLIGVHDSGSKNGRIREFLASESGVPISALSDISGVISAVRGQQNKVHEIFKIRLGQDATVSDVEGYNRQIFERASFDNNIAAGAAESALNMATGVAELIMEMDGSLKGYKVGNIAMSGLFMHYDGDLSAVVRDTSMWQDARARVLPLTNDPHHLVMEYKGELFFGEGVIDEMDIYEPQLARLSLQAVMPGADIRLLESARQAIVHGKNVLLQGSLITSTSANLLVPGTTEALQENAALGIPFSAIANLVEGRDTRGFSLIEYNRFLGEMAGRSIDKVIRDPANNLPNGVVPLKYAEGDDLGGAQVITAALLDMGNIEAVDINDPIAHLRSNLRTDGRQVAHALATALAA